MLLSELFKNVNAVKRDFDAEITSVVTDSRLAEKGCAFFCMNGRNHNSAHHAKEAVENGAAAIISENELDFQNMVLVENIEKALSTCCDNFYNNPSEKMKFIGITGTNGKTSVAHMIKHIFEFCGIKTGVIGTVGNFAGDIVLEETNFTTPEPVKLYSLFNSMVKENARYCVMEASSQALAQGRCEGVQFETAVFTNLTAEHLDYHGSMKEYAKAKEKLFQKSSQSVINLDDEYSDYFSDICEQELTYSLKNKKADLFAENITESEQGIDYTLIYGSKSYKISLKCHGLFSVSNSLAAMGACLFSGVSVNECVEALKSFTGVCGRAEMLNINAPFSVMIDYAHTPDAISSVLSGVKRSCNGRVISLFGCGGNRDREKRPVMLKSAVENSDFVVITSDNPRNENPYDIIKDILKSVNECFSPFAVIENRKNAIEYALKIAEEGDVIVLLGKGHEKYQIMGNGKNEFDEREIVYNALENE